MYCPFCGATDTKVIDSRLSTEGDQVRRRRECLHCSERFTTYEKPELALPRVIKGDGSREPFDERKLSAGMTRALEKRPVETERVELAIHHIRRRLMSMGDRDVDSRQIGEWVMEELRALDQVAYVRFASVYRSFQDVDDFRDELDRLKQQPEIDTEKQQISLLDNDDD